MKPAADLAPQTLDVLLNLAHRRGDAAALSRLYEAAADRQRGADAVSFYLTQAWVWALEAGDRREAALDRRLAALGRQSTG